MKSIAIVACVLALALLASCETPAPIVGQLVDPKIVMVSPDGKEARINIGINDHVRPGQLLYVVRDHKLIGLLDAAKPSEYWTDCVVTASKQVTKNSDNLPIDKVVVGDLVMRYFKDIADVGLPKERVPGMVPTPGADLSTPQPHPDNVTRPAHPETNVPVIPREMAPDWIKTHPTDKEANPAP